MTASGSGALNHYLERDTDKHMMRTKNRPLPSGLIEPSEVLSFGILMVLLGTTLLVSQINILTECKINGMHSNLSGSDLSNAKLNNSNLSSNILDVSNFKEVENKSQRGTYLLIPSSTD